MALVAIGRAVPGEAHEGHPHEALVRRIESFSDIVIGFSLAQLGLSLVIPAHAVDFVGRPSEIAAFIVTFAVLVRFWWTHFKVFRYYFEPNRVMITLNFIALAFLILQVFSLQLYLYFVPKNEGLAAARIYFGFFVCAYGVLGLMFVFGLLFRWKRLTVAQRRAGLRDVFGIFGAVIGCAVGNAHSSKDATNVFVSVHGQLHIVANVPTTIVVGTLVGWLIGMFIGRLGPRFWPNVPYLNGSSRADAA